MNRSDKRHYHDLRHYRSYEEIKSLKQEIKLRKNQRRKSTGRSSPKLWELTEEESPSPRGRKPIGQDDLSPPGGEPGQESDETTFQAMVMSVTRAACTVLRNGMLVQCRVPLVGKDPLAVAVGDQVRVRERPGSGLVLDEVLPRRTVLSRPDPHQAGREKLIVANVDAVVHVVSVRNPPLRIRLIDRYLVAITSGGASPILCVNKIDLLTAEELETEMVVLAPYRELGVTILPCSVETGEGLNELLKAVKGKLVALVGHSGVGKSSILNALHPQLDIRVGTVHEKRGTGRHTTTASSLYQLPGDTRVIDTPGIREFGLWELEPETLRFYFPEFAPIAVGCRFNDCSHDHEPQCVVRIAAEEGQISRARFETYLRMLHELRENPKGR